MTPRRQRGITAHGSQDARIEQAIARGLTATAICDTLGVSADDVHRVWDRLDKAVTEPDVTVSLVHRERLEIGPHGRLLQPHGTHAAFRRHHNRGEKPCADCTVGERRYNTDRKRRRRERAAA